MSSFGARAPILHWDSGPVTVVVVVVVVTGGPGDRPADDGVLIKRQFRRRLAPIGYSGLVGYSRPFRVIDREVTEFRLVFQT